MFMNVTGDRMTRPKRRRQNKRDLVLPDHITGAIPHAGFRSTIGQRLKTERALIKVGRLFGVTDMKFDVICALERQKIFLHRRGIFLFWSSNCRWHDDLLTLSRRARPLNIRSTATGRKVASSHQLKLVIPSEVEESLDVSLNESVVFRPQFKMAFG